MPLWSRAQIWSTHSSVGLLLQVTAKVAISFIFFIWILPSYKKKNPDFRAHCTKLQTQIIFENLHSELTTHGWFISVMVATSKSCFPVKLQFRWPVTQVRCRNQTRAHFKIHAPWKYPTSMILQTENPEKKCDTRRKIPISKVIDGMTNKC